MSKIAISWNVAEPTTSGSLPKMVKDLLTASEYDFGKNKGRVVSVRQNFNSLLNRTTNRENKKREAANLSKLTSYDVLRALTGVSDLKIALTRDDIFAFGRIISKTVGYDNHKSEQDVLDSLSICAADYASHKKNEYMTLADVTAEDIPLEADKPSAREELATAAAAAASA